MMTTSAAKKALVVTTSPLRSSINRSFFRMVTACVAQLGRFGELAVCMVSENDMKAIVLCETGTRMRAMADTRIEHVYNCSEDTFWNKVFLDDDYNQRLFKE